MVRDPNLELLQMWVAVMDDGVDPDLALDVALLVQHNVARERFASDVLDDIESLPEVP